MSIQNDWLTLFEHELAQAEAARRTGNEGKARVCARRAAGHLIGEVINRRRLPSPGPSAYDRLRYLQKLDEIPAEVKTIVGHFMTRVTPDYRLPFEVDLIAEARWLAKHLLTDS